MNKTVIEMDLFSGLLMIDIGLWSRKQKTYRKMAITVDTGASVTTI